MLDFQALGVRMLKNSGIEKPIDMYIFLKSFVKPTPFLNYSLIKTIKSTNIE